MTYFPQISSNIIIRTYLGFKNYSLSIITRILQYSEFSINYQYLQFNRVYDARGFRPKNKRYKICNSSSIWNGYLKSNVQDKGISLCDDLKYFTEYKNTDYLSPKLFM